MVMKYLALALLVSGCSGSAISYVDRENELTGCWWSFHHGASTIEGSVPLCANALSSVENCCHAVLDFSVGKSTGDRLPRIALEIRQDGWRWAFGEYAVRSSYDMSTSHVVVADQTIRQGKAKLTNDERSWKLLVDATDDDGNAFGGTAAGSYSTIVR